MSDNKDIWTPQQLTAIQLLATPTKEPLLNEQIAAMCGTSDTTLWRWRKNPSFQQAVIDLAYEGLREGLPEVYNALKTQAVEKQNVQALKLYLEYAGGLIQRMQIENIGTIDINIGFTNQDTPNTSTNEISVVLKDERRNTRLTDEEVLSIRERVAGGAKKSALAREFGVSAVTVFNIVNGKTHPHLPI